MKYAVWPVVRKQPGHQASPKMTFLIFWTYGSESESSRIPVVDRSGQFA